MKHENLRKHIEGQFDTEFWSQKCTCEPKLIDKIFGDGKRLIHYTPLMTRPNYYIIRVGSDWNEDTYIERMEEVLCAIEEDFGNSDDLREDEELGEEAMGEDFVPYQWPALSDGGGGYGFFEWPRRTISKRRARKLKKRGERPWKMRDSNQYLWAPALFGRGV